jgi:hypothetical protein
MKTIDRMFESIGVSPEYRKALTVACPWCRAREFQPCTILGAPMGRGKAHPSRFDATQ